MLHCGLVAILAVTTLPHTMAMRSPPPPPRLSVRRTLVTPRDGGGGDGGGGPSEAPAPYEVVQIVAAADPKAAEAAAKLIAPEAAPPAGWWDVCVLPGNPGVAAFYEVMWSLAAHTRVRHEPTRGGAARQQPAGRHDPTRRTAIPSSQERGGGGWASDRSKHRSREEAGRSRVLSSRVTRPNERQCALHNRIELNSRDFLVTRPNDHNRTSN